MDTMRLGRQGTLFSSPQADLFDAGPGSGVEAPPDDFVARIRDELRETLALARGASALPWPDLTRATLAELRFRSVSNWLPPDEAEAMRAAFEAELARLYAAEDAAS